MEPTRASDFVELWSLHSRRVYAFIVSLLPRWGDADDILQETSQTAWEKFDDYQSDTNFTAWACRIAYLKVLEARKKQRQVPLPFSDAFLGLIEQELFAQAEAIDKRYALTLDCLQKLPDRDRELIGKRYFQNVPTAELAQELNRSAAWVYKALTRIHRTLLQCVERSLREETEA